MSDSTRAAVVEIVERRKKPEQDSLGASICVPNEVRINGQEIAMPADYPVTVHDLTRNGAVAVTLTVFAQRIFVGHEDIDPDTTDAVVTARRALLDAQRNAAAAQLDAHRALEDAYRQVAEANRRLAAETRPDGREIADRLKNLGLLPKSDEPTDGEVSA